MLVVSRKRDTEICIGSNIVVKVLKIDKRHVRLGVDAPNAVRIWCGEIVPSAEGNGPGTKHKSEKRRAASKGFAACDLQHWA